MYRADAFGKLSCHPLGAFSIFLGRRPHESDVGVVNVQVAVLKGGGDGLHCAEVDHIHCADAHDARESPFGEYVKSFGAGRKDSPYDFVRNFCGRQIDNAFDQPTRYKAFHGLTADPRCVEN